MPAVQHIQNPENPVSSPTHSILCTCQLPAARALVGPGGLQQLEAITSDLATTRRGVWESLLRSGVLGTCCAIYYALRARHLV